MRSIRQRTLPIGWYPERPEEVRSDLDGWKRTGEAAACRAVSCVIPHAGWDYSGKLAFLTLSRMKTDIETVVIVGGHLPPRATLLMASEELFYTPLGDIPGDRAVIRRLEELLDFSEDRHSDNSVEIQLPLIKYLMPSARVVCLRVSPTPEAERLGEALHDISLELGIKMAVVGSTDLTHYGPAYGFAPSGAGESAALWVREENDKTFLDLLLAMNLRGATEHALSEKSACSAGAAVAAASFAARLGVRRGDLVGYHMSSDLRPADSFVGYGGVIYVPAN